MKGQGTVEYVLVIAVLVIAMVAAGFAVAPQIATALSQLGDRAETVYTDGSIAQ